MTGDERIAELEQQIARLEREREWPVLRANAAEAEAARLRDGLRPIVREYDLWSEDANDGEFRLWDLDRLVAAIVAARALPTEDGAARQVKADPAVFGESNRLLGAEDGAAKPAWGPDHSSYDEMGQ